jgi:hypothetical protein
MSLPPGRSRLLRRHFLTPNERVLLETHPSKWWYFSWPTGVGAIWAIVDYLALSKRYSRLPDLSAVWRALAKVPYPASIPSVALLVVIASVLSVGLWTSVVFIDWIQQTYAVTDDRVVQQKGILRHEIQEIPIRHLRDVIIYQPSLRARLLRYGTLHFQSLSDLNQSAADLAVLREDLNPRHEAAQKSGVEWWVGVPNPFYIERTVEGITRNLTWPGTPTFRSS